MTVEILCRAPSCDMMVGQHGWMCPGCAASRPQRPCGFWAHPDGCQCARVAVTPTQLDLLDEGCCRCQNLPADRECICARLFADLDACEAAGLMPWQTQPRKANR